MDAEQPADLITGLDGRIHDLRDYPPAVREMTLAQQQQVIGAICVYGPRRVTYTRPARDGSIVLERPTGHDDGTCWLMRLGPDAQVQGHARIRELRGRQGP